VEEAFRRHDGFRAGVSFRLRKTCRLKAVMAAWKALHASANALRHCHEITMPFEWAAIISWLQPAFSRLERAGKRVRRQNCLPHLGMPVWNSYFLIVA